MKYIMVDDIEFIEDGHIYLKAGIIIPSVSQILKKIFSNKYDGIPTRILKSKSEYGSKVHNIIECIETNKEYKIDNVYIDESIKQYNKIKKENNLQVISQEEIVCYKGIYAGRYDMIANVNGEECLLDIKTTAICDKEYLSWQLTMYEMAIGVKFKKLYCLWLPKGGIGKLIEIERKNYEEIEKIL